MGFMSFPEPIHDDKLRGKPEKFADHYTQATLFFNSQTAGRAEPHRRSVPIRADQSANAGRFAPAWWRALMNVDDDLASRVAQGLGIDLPEPLAARPRETDTPEVTSSAGAVAFCTAR